MKTRLPILARAAARRVVTITIATALAFGASAPFCWSGPTNHTDQTRTPSSVPWQDSQILEPETLAKSLSAATGEKPVVLCVGFPFLYQGGHIVGAKFAGPALTPEGIQALKRQVQDIPRDKAIVIYCGCCPWKHCPNIHPAFNTLQELGFTNVKLLSIPTNFQTDWVAKGFPIEKAPDKK